MSFLHKAKNTRVVKVGLATVLAVSASAIGIALAAGTTVPAPTITSQPANPTAQTSASFKYSDSQSGVSFSCSLDAHPYQSCPASGITYSGPLSEGTHSFSVHAISGTKTSSATSYTWAIDLTPPTVTVAFPAEGGLYNAGTYNEGCTGGPGICGRARDGHAVAAVAVSVKRSAGGWWNGTSFTASTETYRPATLEAPGTVNTGWALPLALPPDGSYVVNVRATDSAGNSSSPSSRTFTVDTTPPPAPTITSAPEAETSSHVATFTFTDGDPSATFLCSRDGQSFNKCTSPKTYELPGDGEHVFRVEAKDAAGNVGAATTYHWTIIKGLGVEGSLVGQLSPGVSLPLALTISNPNTKTVQVTSLHVAAQELSTKAGCTAGANLQLTQSNISETTPVAVPAKGKVTLPSSGATAPRVLMLDTAFNQDACKGATFTFAYTVGGHS
jgi:Bacterial Ig-like domain